MTLHTLETANTLNLEINKCKRILAAMRNQYTLNFEFKDNGGMMALYCADIPDGLYDSIQASVQEYKIKLESRFNAL